MDPISNANRVAAMRLFALVPWPVLDKATHVYAEYEHDLLRAADVGLVMLRGRMGATGSLFNLGEATVTRCSVKLRSDIEGHAYVMGRNKDHARRAALCDALFQEDAATLLPILTALEEFLVSDHRQLAAKAAATKVDFFTMVRGDV